MPKHASHPAPSAYGCAGDGGGDGDGGVGGKGGDGSGGVDGGSAGDGGGDGGGPHSAQHAHDPYEHLRDHSPSSSSLSCRERSRCRPALLRTSDAVVPHCHTQHVPCRSSG